MTKRNSKEGDSELLQGQSFKLDSKYMDALESPQKSFGVAKGSLESTEKLASPDRSPARVHFQETFMHNPF